jgi:hypothetical protein
MFNNKLFSMNLFRFVYFESYQCGSLAAIRYAARTVRKILFSSRVPKYFDNLLPPIEVDINIRVSFSKVASFFER